MHDLIQHASFDPDDPHNLAIPPVGEALPPQTKPPLDTAPAPAQSSLIEKNMAEIRANLLRERVLARRQEIFGPHTARLPQESDGPANYDLFDR